MAATTPQIRPLTRCRVRGHGTGCEPSRERPSRYPRPTERWIALRYENAATGEDT